MRFFGLLALVLFFGSAHASEDLNGIWKGTLTQGAGGCYPQYYLELQINFADNNIIGKAYDYYDKTKYVKLSFTGKYNPQTHRLVLIENKVLEYKIPPDCVPCIKTYDLTWSMAGADETLTGEWKGHISNRADACPPGKIVLKKSPVSDFPVDIEQDETLVSLQKSIHLQPREKELVKSIDVDSPQVHIRLYDNAEIDGDTITVFINDKLVLYRQGLSEKPLELVFNAFPNTEYELVMYADNLGSIPPNTALMVINAGKEKYELFLSSSEQKSAAVKFIYRKK